MQFVTRYAKSNGVNIAYQVLGEGPLQLVFVPGWVSHLELAWEQPLLARFYQRLASFSRLVLFDKRGTGLSDRVAQLPTLEERMDDVRAVMDAVGVPSAALFGVSEGGPMCAMFAATYPERTSALIFYGTYAKRIWAPEYPWAPTPAERQRFFDTIEKGWGGVVDLPTLSPRMANDKAFRRWWAAYLRAGASPGAALALARMNTEIDIRHILPTVRVPTLVLHRRDDRDVAVGGARYIARAIPQAKYVELEGSDHLVFVGDADALLDEVEEFLTGARHLPESDRVLATVLFADIVGSTERAAALGDGRWRELLVRYQTLARGEARAPSRARDRHGRGRGARGVRRAGPGDPMRLRAPRRGPRVGNRDPGRPPHRGVRGDRLQVGRHRGAYRRACGGRGRRGRGPGLEHGQGLGRRIGSQISGPRRPRAEGDPRGLASVRRRSNG